MIIAVTLAGLSAGLFATFSYAVMPGLRRTDDATFVGTMRAINVAILNPAFAVVFVGAAVALVAALVASRGTAATWWLVAALVLYVAGAWVVTASVNIPLNDALAADDDATAARADFERRWVVANHVRSALTTAALVCSAVAAVVADLG